MNCGICWEPTRKVICRKARWLVAGAVVFLVAGYSGSGPLGPWLIWAAEPPQPGEPHAGEPQHSPDAQPKGSLPQAAKAPGHAGTAAKLPPQDAETLAKLAVRIPLDFEAAPATEGIEHLADRLGADIVAAERFRAADVPITLKVRSVSASKALELLLKQTNAYSSEQQYDFLVRDGTIFIVAAEQAIHLRVYDCHAVLAAISPDHPDALVNLIKDSVEPESWVNNSGPGTATILGGMLVVRQRASVHRQSDELLGLLAANENSEPR